ncbi:hypothetical protein ACRQ5Q_22210 [Bradyrhizobium sp. PMVTL-01]|uniref:hypothetical protein n=1 Tax=Bradyrhizobium sp. PMVTL-01 TaxID=3434999 RepID=UPI003F6E78E7
MTMIGAITLRFVTGSNPISFAIRAAEYGFWASHVEALMPDGTLLGAHVDSGVLARPRDYDKGSFTKELLVTIPAGQAMVDRFHAFLREQLGKPYDVEAIAAFVARRDWQDPSAWFCSELQAAALAASGWFATPLATEFNHITPRDLLLIVSGRVAITAEKEMSNAAG